MKNNNKGFAISIMLYAMVLLIVTIFYIILAIVKNRYNTSEELVDNAVNFMETNDSYARASDRAAPIIVFTKNTSVIDQNGLSNLDIYVYDDNISMDNINDKIKMTINNSTVNLNCSKVSSGISSNIRCSMKNTPTISNDIIVTVTAKDDTNNITTEKRKFYLAKQPICNEVEVLSERTGGPLSKRPGASFPYVLLGDYVVYKFKCSSDSGIDAFFNDSDFGSVKNNLGQETLSEFKVTYERNPNNVVIRIVARAVNESSATRVNLGTGSDSGIKICGSSQVASDISNCTIVSLPYIEVIQAAATH